MERTREIDYTDDVFPKIHTMLRNRVVCDHFEYANRRLPKTEDEQRSTIMKMIEMMDGKTCIQRMHIIGRVYRFLNNIHEKFGYRSILADKEFTMVATKRAVKILRDVETHESMSECMRTYFGQDIAPPMNKFLEIMHR